MVVVDAERAMPSAWTGPAAATAARLPALSLTPNSVLQAFKWCGVRVVGDCVGMELRK